MTTVWHSNTSGHTCEKICHTSPAMHDCAIRFYYNAGANLLVHAGF